MEYVCLAPDSAPRDVRVRRLNATHVNISWVKLTLDEARGFVTLYTIRYDSVGSRNKRAVKIEVAGPESSYKVIGGVGITESYSVTVSASTSAGEGIIGTPVIVSGKS